MTFSGPGGEAVDTPATSPRRRGRRPGESTSRQEVLQAARGLFAEQGYENTTVRGIAAKAAVDAALVVRLFGGKEQLFAAVLDDLGRTQSTLLAVLHGDSSRLGERIAASYFHLWEAPDTGQALRGLLRGAIGSQRATSILKDFVTSPAFAKEATPAIALLGGMLLGIATIRYVVRAGPLAEMSLDELIALVGPTIQTTLAPPTPR